MSPENSNQPEAWKAGGYAIWFMPEKPIFEATGLASIIRDIYPEIYPVFDSHITCVGNIFKGVVVPDSIDKIRSTVSYINKRLRRDPLKLTFEKLHFDCSKPSQTLVMVAKENRDWQVINNFVAHHFGLVSASPNPMIHSSIIYNSSNNFPLTDGVIEKQILPLANNLIKFPLEIIYPKVIGVQTQGAPSGWKVLT